MNSVLPNAGLPHNETEQSEPTAFARSPDDSAAPVILIVEDDEDNRLMLRLMLEIWNYRVHEAKNGFEAIEVAKKENPNLILMDVRMPRLDGFETARMMRRSDVVDGTPIIFLSGCAQRFYRQIAFEAGGDEFLTKPVDFHLLETLLSRYTRPQ